MDSSVLIRCGSRYPNITFSVAVSKVPRVNSRTVTVTASGFADLAYIAGNLKRIKNSAVKCEAATGM